MNYTDFYSPERTLAELAASVCGDTSLKARNIHNDKMRQIMKRTGWDDRLIREELFDFHRSMANGCPVLCPAKVLSQRLNTILAALKGGAHE